MDWYFHRKSLADDILDGFVNRGQKAYLIFERRRMGKTEFLQKDLAPLAEKKGFIPIYISFYDSAVAPVQLLNYRFEQILYNWNKVLPHRDVRRVDVKSIGGVELEPLARRPQPTAPNALLLMDQMIGSLCKEDKVLLLLDEFQDVALHPKSDAFLKQFRSSIDARAGRVCAVFTGSSLHGLQTLFHDDRKPFYGFATQIDFPAFGDAFVKHCCKGYKQRTRQELPFEEAKTAFETFERVTAHFRHYVERRLLTGCDHETAIAQVRQEFSGDFRYLNQWLGLNAQAQAILLLISSPEGDGRIYTKPNRQAYQSLLDLPETPASEEMQPTVRKLLRKTMIDKEGRGRYRLVDPRFADFILSRDET